MEFSTDLPFTRGADLPSGLHDQSIYLVAIQVKIISDHFASDIPPLQPMI